MPPTITIDPSAMPAGAELSTGYFQLSSGQAAGEQQADVVLIDTSSYTCTSTSPDPTAHPPAPANPTAWGCCTAVRARPGRKQPQGCTATPAPVDG